jgi:hypothetical protein
MTDTRLGPNMQILVPVADVDRAATFHEDAYDLWLAFVSNPDGNTIGLMREAPKGLEHG